MAHGSPMMSGGLPPLTDGAVQVYRAARGWKIFLSIAPLPLVLLFGWVMLLPFTQDRTGQIWAGAFLFLLGAGFVALFVSALIAVYKERIEVHADRIRKVDLFKTRELPLQEISGYRIIPTQYVTSLQLCSRDPQAKALQLTLMVERKEELLAWVAERFQNLDERDAEAELNQVLDDRELGETREERASALDRARLWTRIVNGAGYITLFWALFKPEPYRLVVGILLILPWIALLLLRCYPGAIAFDAKRQSQRPDVAIAFLMPCIILALRAMLDFDILAWENFWTPFVALSLALFAAVVLLATELRGKIGMLLLLALFVASYGYAATITLNGLLDHSPPQTYYATVMEKRISHGKHTAYYVKLSPWGPRKTEEEVDVGRGDYERHEVGDQVPVSVRQGRFAIPWFYLDD